MMLPLLLDGGLGTILEENGYDLQTNELWSARLIQDDPEGLQRIHEAFFDAGCEIVTSAGYQFSFEGCKKAGISSPASLINKSVELVDRARSSVLIKESSKESGLKRYIAASFGTFGATLPNAAEYTGIFGVDVDELVRFHVRRLLTLFGNDCYKILPDFCAFETIPCLDEVRAITLSLNKLHLPICMKVWVSLACCSHNKLNSGESVQEALEILDRCESVSYIGFNCMSPNIVTGLLELVEKLGISKRLIIYPNSGEQFVDSVWVQNSRTTDSMLLEQMRTWLARWPDRIAILGGCCRIGIPTLKNMRQYLDSYKHKHIFMDAA